MIYPDLAILCRHIRQVERARIGAELQLGAFDRAGVYDELAGVTVPYIGELAKLEAKLKRQLPKTARGEPWLDAVGEYVNATPGLGPAVFYVIGLVPPLPEFANPAKLWKYLGLHVSDGRSVRARPGQLAGFSLFLRAIALQRIADPIVKQGGPYREVYDTRKAYTLTTHPPMTEDCATCLAALQRTKEHRAEHKYTRERKAPGMDCANLGGMHWTDGHRHRDAMRYMAKRVWRDIWKVAHGAIKPAEPSRAVPVPTETGVAA